MQCDFGRVEKAEPCAHGGQVGSAHHVCEQQHRALKLGYRQHARPPEVEETPQAGNRARVAGAVERYHGRRRLVWCVLGGEHTLDDGTGAWEQRRRHFREHGQLELLQRAANVANAAHGASRQLCHLFGEEAADL